MDTTNTSEKVNQLWAKISLKETVQTKIIPSLRHSENDLDEETSENEMPSKDIKRRAIKSISELVALAASGNLLSRVTIDARHMWIAKRIAHCFTNTTVNQIEAAVSSPLLLAKLNEFLGMNAPRTMYCLYDSAQSPALQIEFQPCEIQIGKIFYMIRLDDLKGSLDAGFENKVLVGECNSRIIKSLSLMLQHVYSPLINAETCWGQCSEEDRSAFNSSLARFTMTLTDIVCTIDSQVQLKKVNPALLEDCSMEAALSDEKLVLLVHQFEIIVQDWEGAAENLLKDEDPTLFSLADVRPDAPLQYWRQRLANLNALNEQLESAQTAQVLAVLTTAKSDLIKSWQSLEARLREATLEANENVKHLAALDKQFEVLYEGLPSKIAEDLGAIFLKIKRVRVMSKYLQNTENMNGLLVKITNQIIQKCKQYIYDGGSLWRQDPLNVVCKMKECSNMNNHCQVQYRIAKHERVGAVKDLPFFFDESRIFAKFELFSARLVKLIEIFDVYGFFKNLASQDTFDLSHICNRYFREVESFKQRPYDLLDFTEMSFEGDYKYMCMIATEIEKDLQKVIDEAFELIESTDQALDLLSEFQKLMPRDSLRPYLNAKHVDIFNSFTQEMEAVSNMYETQKENPPVVRNAPPVAGRILWVRHLLRLIEAPMQKFRENGALMISSEAKIIIKKYNKIASALVDFEVLWAKAWCSAAGAAKLSLNTSLLIKHPDDGKVYVNFDKAIIQMLRECHYMRKLQIEIPATAQSLLEREIELKRHADALEYMLVCFDNAAQIVLPDLRSLLSPLLSELDLLLHPGMNLLTWTSVNVECYINEVLAFLKRFRDVVAKIRDIYENRIQRNLRTISRALLVSLPSDVIGVDDFAGEQIRVIRERVSRVNNRSAEIEVAVKDCISVATHATIATMSTIRILPSEVEKFYNTVWELLFHAVLTCVKRSINALKVQVRSSFGSGIWIVDRPIFKVNVEVVLLAVKTNPTLEDVQEAVNRCALNILRSIKIRSWASHPVKAMSQGQDIDERIRTSKEIVRVVLLLTGSVGRTTTTINDYLKTLMRFSFLWSENEEDGFSAKLVVDENSLKGSSIETFIEKLMLLDSIARKIDDIPSAISIGPISLSHDSFKKFLHSGLQDIKHRICAKHCAMAKTEILSCLNWMQDMSIKIKGGVRDLDDVRNVRSAIQEIISETFEMEEQFGKIDSRYHTAQEFGHPIPEEEISMLTTLRTRWAELQMTNSAISDKLRWAQEGFKSDLMKAIALFGKEVKALFLDFQSGGPNDPDISPSIGMERLRSFQAKYEEKLPKVTALHDGEELFGLPKSKYPDLEQIKLALTALAQFYTLYTTASHAINKYMEMSPSQLSNDLTSIEQEIHNLQKKVIQIPKQFWKFVAFKEMKEKVENFILICPLLALMTRRSVKPRHWEELMVLTGANLDYSSPSFAVKNLIAIDLLKYRDGIDLICTAAQRELECEEMLDLINKKWQHAAFSFKNFKNLGPILLDVSECHVLIEGIEESQVALSVLMETKSSAHFHAPILEIQGRLSVLSDLLDLWLDVQRIFCNVQVVFAAEDISKQLPQETSRFQNVSKTFVSLIQEAYAIRFAMILVSQDEHFRSKLRDMRDQLEASQKFLSVHLNAKRDIFPRLFLIPDPLLLEALSLGPDFHSMRYLLACLFDSVHSLLRVPQRMNAISGMQSAEGEAIDFVQEIEWEASIETLLLKLESSMKISISRSIRLADSHVTEAYSMENIESLLSVFPTQSCVLGLLFWWTSACQLAFSQGAKDLNSVATKMLSMQSKILALVTGNIPHKHRVKIAVFIEALLIQKDITAFLTQKQLRISEAFDWQKQLKFRWNSDEHVCELKTLHHTVKHTFEYIGCKRCLVVPCLTNRNYLFIIQSIAGLACTHISGSSGCGKSSTVKELGRKLGRFVVEFSSTPESNQSGMSRMLSGVSQSGIWGCFDGLHCASSEVMSVLAVCFTQIFDAQRANKTSFMFVDGDDIALQKSSSFFNFGRVHVLGSFTVKPLPTNLRSHFRILTMIVPSYENFSRIKLYASKFEQSDALANKINSLYMLCKDIFEAKLQYDFGPRSLNRLVLSLIACKMASADDRFDEFQTCAQLLQSMHVPSLDAEDISIFTSFLEALFGDCSANKSQDGVETQLRQVIQSSRIKASPELIKKVIQIFNISKAKHSLVLVGPTCTGKSLSCSILLQGLSKIEDCPKKAVYLNPLSMSSEQMFGWFDGKNKEWTDGAFTSLWRRAMRNKMIHTWIILDGPIDTAWAEYLETVFDDVKELNLANGDRIAMDESCRIVLEVEGLKSASPATLVRVGIVSFAESDAELSHLTTAWLLGRRAEEGQQLLELFQCFIDPIWELVSKECEPVLGQQPRAQMQSFLVLLASLLSPSVLSNEVVSRNILERFVIFALAWASMGLLKHEDRLRVDKKFAELTSNLPGTKQNKTILDHYLTDTESGQQTWVPIFPSSALRDASALLGDGYCLTNLFVPNGATENISKLNQILQMSMYPLVVVGDPGSGKTTLINNCMLETVLLQENLVTTQILLRRTDTAHHLQELLCRRVRKRSGKIYGPAQGKKLLILIEDVNLPHTNRWGDHPVSETLRFLLERASLYNVYKPEEQYEVVDTRLISTIQSLSNGITEISHRLRRHIFCVYMDAPSRELLKEIFEPILLTRYKYTGSMSISSEMLTAMAYCLEATLDLFLSLREKLLSIHNLHPITRVIQGIIQVRPETLFSPLGVISLWHHECERELLDRLQGPEITVFADCMHSVCLNNFGIDISATSVNDQKWTNLLPSEMATSNATRNWYRVISDPESLMNRGSELLEEYNSKESNISEKLAVILFSELLSHLLRILRIICLERGHPILVSEAREGKSSITRLAAFAASTLLICRPKNERIQISHLLSDVKKLYLYAGLKGASATMMVCFDDSIEDEMLDFIATAVSNVDSDIFSLEEWGGLLIDPEFQASIDQERRLSDSLVAWDSHSLFLHRIRRNIHFALLFSMSPDRFRARMKAFPSLSGHCTIDAWPAWSSDSPANLRSKEVGSCC